MTSPPVRQRMCVIFNPKAGKGLRILRPTLDGLKSLGVTCDLLETRCAGDGIERARQALEAGGYDAVVAAGGDGTINEVANGLTGSETPMGIIPAGTANALSYELGLSESPQAFAEALAFGSVRTVCPGSVNGRYFLLVVGVGLDARVVHGVSLSVKRVLGKGAYALSAIRELLRYDPPVFQVTVEGREYEAAWVLVFKTSRYAGDWVAEPMARMEEPGLSVQILPAGNLKELFPHFMDYFRKRPLAGAEICLRHVKSVRIEGTIREPVQMDGDPLGYLPVEIEVAHRTLRIIGSTLISGDLESNVFLQSDRIFGETP